MHENGRSGQVYGRVTANRLTTASQFSATVGLDDLCRDDHPSGAARR